MKKFQPSTKALKRTLAVQTHSHDYGRVLEFIINEVKDLDGVTWSKDKHDNFYITKGKIKQSESYPCVVAHHDTVHKVLKGEGYRIHESDGWLYAFDHCNLEQAGTGGDDLVGVWCALELLRNLPTIKVALFSQEEIGCVGSGKADMKFFKDVGYVFQTDRKGNSDFVNKIGNVKLSSAEFIAEIQPNLDKYKYTVTDGGLTDVKTLTTKGIGVCTANMSSGYYRPHSDTEIVCIKDAKNVCRMMRDMIYNLGYTKWELQYEAPTYTSYGGYGGYARGVNSHYDWSSYGSMHTRDYNSGWANIGSSWSRKSSYNNKTKLKEEQIANFLFMHDNIFEATPADINRFIDNLKFVVVAKKVHPLTLLEDCCVMAEDILMDTPEKGVPAELYNMSRKITVEDSLFFLCNTCGDASFDEVDIDGVNNKSADVVACMSCNSIQSIYSHLFQCLKAVKQALKETDDDGKDPNQLSLDAPTNNTPF